MVVIIAEAGINHLGSLDRALKMVEAAAEATEEFMNKYLEEGDLSEDEIKLGIRTRTIASEMSKSLGQPVLVENRPGAGGRVGMTQLMNGKPDGYLISIAIPLSVPSSRWPLLSLPRFGLVVFPLFLALAAIGRRPRVHTAIVTVGALLLGVVTVQWALWQWVA